ncbi:hypothetical protein PYCC9005_002385 [Savitreella phatthalungensis]
MTGTASSAFARTLFRQSLILLSWLPPLIFIENHVASIAVVDGISMKPAFNPESNLLWRDWVLENKWFWFGRHSRPADSSSSTPHDPSDLFRRGEVVVMRSPTQNRLVTKRVVALAGDIVSTRAPEAGHVVTVPQGHVWVEGDERFHSTDSNTYGPVPINLIQSKVSKIIWPPSRFGNVPEGGRDPRITKRRMRVDGNAADWLETGPV